MADGIIGKWKFVEWNNFENYLKSINVPPECNELLMKSKPTVEYKKTGNKMSINMDVGNVKHNIEFELGKEFEEPRLDGKASKTTYNMEGSNKLVQTIKFDDGSESTCTREIQDNHLSVTYKHGNVIATGRFEKA